MKSKKKPTMSEAARKARNAYHNQWAKNNPDKVRQYHVNYWERKTQEMKEG